MSLADQVNQIRALAKQGKTEVEIAATVGLEIGDVATVLAGAGVGSFTATVGAVMVHEFSFQHDTPGLLTGVPFYTPQVGERLIDAWFEIDEAWNGTTPQGDMGFLQGDIWGWFGDIVNAVDLTVADQTDGSGFLSSGMSTDHRGWQPPHPPNQVAPSSLSRALLRAYVFVNAGTGAQAVDSPMDAPVPRTQSRFLTDEPVKLVVSQTGGTTTGVPDFGPAVDPGATQGKATVCLMTAI